MATYLEIQTQVQNRVIDLPSVVQDEVPDLINQAIRRAEQAHNYRCMEASQAATTAEDTPSLVTLPADWKAKRGDPYLRLGQDGELGDRHIGWLADLQDAVASYDADNPDERGEPRELLETATALLAYPVPDTSSEWDDGNHRVVIPYWKYLADLSADADSNWFTVNGPDYIVARACAEAFFLNWDEQRGAFWLGRAEDPRNPESELRKMRRLDAAGRAPTVQVLQPRPGALGYYRRG